MAIFQAIAAAAAAALLAFAPAAGAAEAQDASAPRSPVVVVAGRESLASDGERRFAASLSRHAVRWLRDAGLAADLADDSELASTLSGRSVAILVYCAKTTRAQESALASFVAGGGRLVVCYSSSPALASLMGVTLGNYRRDDRGGRWARIHFASDRPANLPEYVIQSSPNIHQASPRTTATSVLAWWEDRAGRSTGEAAWLQSSSGFWMTHVLLADGDASAKGQMLLALVAACDPSLWRTAAAARIGAVAEAPPYKGTAAAIAAAALVPDSGRRARAMESAESAAQAEADARRLLADGRGAAAWLAANDWSRLLTEVYGLAQEPKSGEIRAVWDTSGQGLYPGDWQRTCRLLKDSGISDVFVNAAGIGYAHCDAAGLPASAAYRSGGDLLAQCIEAARPLGLRVHAWFFCFSTSGATQERLRELRANGWLLSDASGERTGWIDPANEEARAAIVAAVADVAARYPVDGVHLDFVRYPDFQSSLGERTRAAFAAATGAETDGWPAPVGTGGESRAAFIAWRARQVALLVAGVRSAMQARAPGKTLSAAVYGMYPSCLESVGQHWESWIDQGLVDYAVPMDYTESDAMLGKLLSRHSRTRRIRSHVVAGIGVTAAESRLGASDVIRQVLMTRSAGMAGFALFDLDTTLEREVLPVLRAGLTSPE